jgi:hypothetical protein
MTRRFSKLPAGSDFLIASVGQLAEGGEEQSGIAFAHKTLDEGRDIGGSIIDVGQEHDGGGGILLFYPFGNVGGRDVGGEAVIEEHGVYGFVFREFESAGGDKNGQASEAGCLHDHAIDLEVHGVVVDEQDGNLTIHCSSD